MVDIHSHILWGLDDGAKTMDDSLAMVRMAAAAGTTDIVATPHASYEYHFDADLVEQKLKELQTACGPAPALHYGCDFHLMFENIEDALQHPRKYTINHGNYLMVEFSDAVIAPNMSDVLQRLGAAGIRPVITHPERNSVLQRTPKMLDGFFEIGCLVQVTAQSLTGLFGRQAEQAAWKLMERGMVHFVASDAHETARRTTDMRQAWKAVAERFGPERAEQLLDSNPAAAVRSEALPFETFELNQMKKKWYQLW